MTRKWLKIQMPDDPYDAYHTDPWFRTCIDVFARFSGESRGEVIEESLWFEVPAGLVAPQNEIHEEHLPDYIELETEQPWD